MVGCTVANLAHDGSLRLDTNAGAMDTFPFAGFLLKERGRKFEGSLSCR